MPEAIRRSPRRQPGTARDQHVGAPQSGSTPAATGATGLIPVSRLSGEFVCAAPLVVWQAVFGQIVVVAGL
jgi:hypothetical protein